MSDCELSLTADDLPLDLLKQLVHPLLTGAGERDDAFARIGIHVQ